MNMSLPTALWLSDGNEHPIRADYRAVLDLFQALNDPDATPRERGYYLLNILYISPEDIPPELYEEAVEQGLWFLRGGDEGTDEHRPKLVDWEQDFPIIIAAVNRVAGREVRAIPEDDGRVTGTAGLHWWTFLAYYQEIGGECTFAQIVSIRDKLQRGKRLEKAEREYYQRNRRLIDFRQKLSTSEEEFLGIFTRKKETERRV